jgi:hypothetical protein
MAPIMVTDTGDRSLTRAEAAQWRRDRDTWWDATTLAELAKLTADWLEGRNLYLPAYGAANPDPETWPLIGRLAGYNRAGFMTTGSQPGHGPQSGFDGWLWQQRAAVNGFCDLDTAVRITDALGAIPDGLAEADGAGLYVWAVQTRDRWPHHITATIRTDPADPNESRVNAVWGVKLSARDIRQEYRGNLNPAAIRALRAAWQVTVADPEFGAHERVWDALDAVLCPPAAVTEP